jgi:hypothetical protein
MNDNDLSTAVRESVADIHSATPVAQIISRGRAVRARRRIPGVAGVLTVAAGAALAVPMLLPSGHPGSHPARIQLDAWTVVKQANGDIDVTINQLRNPAGLQSTLRADGLPVSVTFSDSASDDGLSASCQPYVASPHVVDAVVTFASGAFMVINPSALPRGAGLGIFVDPHLKVSVSGTPQHREFYVEASGTPQHSERAATAAYAVVGAGPGTPQALMTEDTLVHTSQQCTG